MARQHSKLRIAAKAVLDKPTGKGGRSVGAVDAEKLQQALNPERISAALAASPESAYQEVAALRQKVAQWEPLIAKGAEAMGFIRWAAICWKLNGESWSEEPGFAQRMTDALLDNEREVSALRADRARLDWMEKSGMKWLGGNSLTREQIDAAMGHGNGAQNKG